MKNTTTNKTKRQKLITKLEKLHKELVEIMSVE